MSSEIVKLQNISKWFYLFSQKASLAHILLGSLLSKEKFFALKGINLSLCKGDSVALIGKNGAGKTLLMKIISGMVHPSSGLLMVKESVAPIFGYAAAFHPELSGRDNIFLYGSLLGIRRSLIKKCFNEIVCFSEINEYIDMKIKYYSTGMKIRLAFSVVTLLEPEILLLDEALAPGDISFIEKAHDKILELKKRGITMIITAHSDDLLREFCNKGIVIERGEIKYTGDLESSISYFRKNIVNLSTQLATNALK